MIITMVERLPAPPGVDGDASTALSELATPPITCGVFAGFAAISSVGAALRFTSQGFAYRRRNRTLARR